MEPTGLRQALVVEAGVRQAWPFLTFAWWSHDRECRLYIDTAFLLDGEHHDHGDAERAAAALLDLNNRTVIEATADDERRLTVRFEGDRFEGDRVLIVEGTPATFTAGDVWWFGQL
jgi:hypothetical protein